jgi:hypothetical protein
MTIATVNGVRQAYGPRTRGEGTTGTMATRDASRFAVVIVDGANYTSASLRLPAGATITGNAIVEVTEEFNLGGTAPVINIGVEGSEGTNRLAQVSEAQAEAVGTYSIASAGTLAVNTPLAAAVTIKVALGGTTPTITSAGLLKLSIPYQVI